MITIELGETLQSLHRFLNTDEQERGHDFTYHDRLPRLLAWLRRLQDDARIYRQKELLRLCQVMLASDPTLRPSARQVYEELCMHLSLDPDYFGAACSCCSYRSGSLDRNTSRTPVLRSSVRIAPLAAFLLQRKIERDWAVSEALLAPSILKHVSHYRTSQRSYSMVSNRASASYLSQGTRRQYWFVNGFDAVETGNISFCHTTAMHYFALEKTSVPDSAQPTSLRLHLRTYILHVVVHVRMLRGRQKSAQSSVKLSLALSKSVEIGISKTLEAFSTLLYAMTETLAATEEHSLADPEEHSVAAKEGCPSPGMAARWLANKQLPETGTNTLHVTINTYDEQQRTTLAWVWSSRMRDPVATDKLEKDGLNDRYSLDRLWVMLSFNTGQTACQTTCYTENASPPL